MKPQTFFKWFFLIWGAVCIVTFASIYIHAYVTYAPPAQYSACSAMYQVNVSQLDNITFTGDLPKNLTLCPVYIPECLSASNIYKVGGSYIP